MLKSQTKRAIGWIKNASRTTREKFIEQIAIEDQRRRILCEILETMPKNPILFGRKIYSQTDEDGIISEIFRRIGITSRIFLEFGCGSGVENNTHALLLSGWRGLWVDGDSTCISRIHSAFVQDSTDPNLILCEAHVTRDNIREICQQTLDLFNMKGEKIDLLSMDLDGNDLHLLSEIVYLRPRVICCEYNALLGPDIEAYVKYDPNHKWKGDDYQGMSLSAARNLLEPLGYVLICCNLSGVNAFFVEEDVAKRFGDYSYRQIFQEARYHFIFLQDYYPRTLRFSAEVVRYKDLSFDARFQDSRI